MLQSASKSHAGQVIDRRYTLVRPLGEGGMGAVYLANDQVHKTQVALKWLTFPKHSSPAQREHLVQRMKREIKVLLLVDDPRVIQLKDWGNDPTFGFYYAMELLPQSCSLKDYLKENEPTLQQRLHLLSELLAGLGAMHELNIIHRDLKPHNALVVDTVPKPQIKLIDPGIAKPFGVGINLQETTTIHTEPGSILGTPIYMAPEMWTGEEVDARTDIYQMGIVCYEVLLDQLPFAGTLYNVMLHHMQTPIPSMVGPLRLKYPELSEEVALQIDDAIRVAASKDPQQRFLRAWDFGRTLVRLQEACQIDEPDASALLATLPYKQSSRELRQCAPQQATPRPLPSGTALLASPHGSSAHLPATTPQTIETKPTTHTKTLVWLCVLIGIGLAIGLWTTHRWQVPQHAEKRPTTHRREPRLRAQTQPKRALQPKERDRFPPARVSKQKRKQTPLKRRTTPQKRRTVPRMLIENAPPAFP